jgi:hypothetical protein
VADDKKREDEYQADLAAWEARQAARERLAAQGQAVGQRTETEAAEPHTNNDNA